MASIVTRAPLSCPASARRSSRSGMAVISLVFSGTLRLGQGEPGVGRIGAQGVQGLEPAPAVVGAPGSLAVDGNEIVAVWPQRGDPALEVASEHERVDAVDEGAQPALTRDAVVEGREAAQNGEVVRAPGNDVVEVVAGGDGRAGDQEQHLMEGV